LIDKYSKQLQLYTIALEYGMNRPVDECLILDLKSAKLIKLKK